MKQISPAMALHESLSPGEFSSREPECVGDSASLRITFGTFNNDPTDVMEYAELDQISLSYDYQHDCALKSIEEKGGLAHFIPFNQYDMIEPPSYT